MLDTDQATLTGRPTSHVTGRRTTPAGRGRRRLRRAAWLLRRRAHPYPLVTIPVALIAMPAAVVIAGGSLPAAAVALLVVLALDVMRSQPPRLIRTAMDEIPAVSCVGLIGLLAAAAVGLPVATDQAGPVGVVIATGWYAAFTLAGRAVGYRAIRVLRQRRRLVSNAIIIGTGQVAARLIQYLREHPEYGHRPVGVLTRSRRSPSCEGQLPVLGDYTDLATVVRHRRVDAVFVTVGHSTDGELVQVIRACHRTRCEIYLVPRPFELGASDSPHTETVWGLPCRPLRRAPFRHASWQLKRLSDILFAALGLLVTAPLMAMIALALRIANGRGVLFRQRRLTQDGRTFELVKFRTMKPPPLGQLYDAPDAGRVTRIGRFLRRSSLDELPQLWNVLTGDMSLVGPRPEQPGLAEELAREHRGYAARLRVPAGLTGLAQVHDLRGDTSIEDRARLDNLYIETWSLWLDIKIMILTISSVVLLRGR